MLTDAWTQDAEPVDGPHPPERSMSAMIEAELARTSVFKLPFVKGLEVRYEATTKAARAWNIRLTLVFGLIAYNVFGFVDSAILPDLAWLPGAWRILVISPVAILAMWKCGSVDAGIREAFLTVMMAGAILGPIAFILISHAPLAPYTMLVVVLASMFGTITIRLRFHWAGLYTMFTMIAVMGMLWLKQDLPFALSVHLFIAISTCISFGLLANNQLERAERRSFLLGLRETLRSEQLATLSRLDSLTGLANRRTFDLKLIELWRRCRNPNYRFALLMVDVDHFKRFNDFYGHPAGDGCLQRVAHALTAAVDPARNLVARYGGEEFAILLDDCELADAMVIAESVRLSVYDANIVHDNLEDGRSQVSVSIGVGSNNSHGFDTMAALIQRADRNLYVAKRAGRNRVVHDPATPADGAVTLAA